MPSPVYTQMLNLIGNYVDKEKAAGVINRQLASKSLNAEILAAKDLSAIMTAVSTAVSLYVPDPARRDELKSKLKAMV